MAVVVGSSGRTEKEARPWNPCEARARAGECIELKDSSVPFEYRKRGYMDTRLSMWRGASERT